MSTVNLYSCRDAMWLDQQGGHYVRHVDHMTREGLHSKSDIAAELGWRDYQIAELTRQVSALQLSHDNIINSIGIKGDGSWSKLIIEYVMGLVAENAIQDFIITAVKDLVRESNGVVGWHLNGDIATWDEVLPELSHSEAPVTDAAIAEIGAKAVDELSSLCFISYNHQHPVTEEFLGFCKQFAANLRAGRKG
ncbi:hypothetical protein [Ewingella americana]|uniref:hypothetical protein n=1 Tax=Ewingella americana TaxID=41202 RepID=UPI0012ADF061|nr:hypothetical protein [Ewingella americana]MRT01925.1 hypothetical protein [Ewingella americana]